MIPSSFAKQVFDSAIGEAEDTRQRVQAASIPQTQRRVEERQGESREPAAGRTQSDSTESWLLRDGINSSLLLLYQIRFRGCEIVWLVAVVVLPGHLRIFGNLREIVIEKRESRVIHVV